jgi:hypothetical protein
MYGIFEAACVNFVKWVFHLGDTGFQSVGLLFILECKLLCSDVKHGHIVGGKKKRYVENKVLGKY